MLFGKIVLELLDGCRYINYFMFGNSVNLTKGNTNDYKIQHHILQLVQALPKIWSFSKLEIIFFTKSNNLKDTLIKGSSDKNRHN